MTPARPSRFDQVRTSARAGFTLVEMLVVMAIIAILAVLALPAVKGVIGSMDMKGAANIVAAQFDLARQTASTRNVQVEVRIYQDPTFADTTAGTAYSYRIMAVVIPAAASGAVSDEFVSPGIALPGDIIFDQTYTPATKAFSTLLDPTQVDPSGALRAVATEATTAPLLLKSKQYMKVTFLSNGTVYLVNTSGGTAGTWCLSLRGVHATPVTSPNPAPAQNFITMVLDPSTSRARVYQP